MATKQSHLEAQLLALYGPLLTPEHLANLMHRQPNGMRYSLTATGAIKALFQQAHIQIGRRVYYRACDVAAVLAGGCDEL